MTTKRSLVRILGVVDLKLQRCWEILAELKASHVGNLPEFQPLLSECLMILSDENRRIAHERSNLNERKKRLNPKWFAQRHRGLAARQSAIRRARAICLTLGNAFAWVFYQNDPELLEEHSKHQPTGDFPTGAGGMGERAFVMGFPLIDGAMVLHHGITTMLRIGDISLLDLSTFRVTGIAELKTSETKPGELKIEAMIIRGKQDAPAATAAQAHKGEQFATLTPRQRARLERQIRCICSILEARAARKAQNRIGFQEQRRIRELEEMLSEERPGHCFVRQLDDGVVALGFQRKKQGLFQKVFEPKDFRSPRFPSILPEHVARTAGTTPSDNAVWLNALLYSDDGDTIFIPGTMPLFWWPMDLEIIRRVVFQELVIVIVFNPAHFLEKLRNHGFTASLSSDGREMLISSANDTSSMEIVNCEYFVHLITHVLFSEEFVADTLRRMADGAIESVRGASRARVDLRFNHTWQAS